MNVVGNGDRDIIKSNVMMIGEQQIGKDPAVGVSWSNLRYCPDILGGGTEEIHERPR
jgi:hypothetical protein